MTLSASHSLGQIIPSEVAARERLPTPVLEIIIQRRRLKLNGAAPEHRSGNPFGGEKDTTQPFDLRSVYRDTSAEETARE